MADQHPQSQSDARDQVPDEKEADRKAPPPPAEKDRIVEDILDEDRFQSTDN